jgi:O-antigen/teichoic acid export membrane protein
MSAPRNDALGGKIRRGLAWSTLSSTMLRLGSLLVGVVLARLLAPEDFGVYAIALAVQSVLMTLADLGMSVDLVRAPDPVRRAPTVATVSLVSGIVLALVMTLTAGPAAALMGAPNATDVIMVLSWTIVVSAAGVVPYAKLQREFDQRSLFICSLVDFAVGTTTTIALVKLGMGPMALAVGRVVAQSAATALQFFITRVRPRFGFDRAIARSALVFGIPLAGANFLSWALLNIDNVVISRVAGLTALGLYVLAFNISSWPMTVIGQAIRSVSLAGFSHAAQRDDDRALLTGLGLTWAVALPVGVLLAALARPLVVLLYGERWSSSAAVLAALGFFGALRVVLDLFATYLMARGAARPVLYVQILWFVALIPAVAAGAHWMGINGAGWAHVAVATVLILPAYAVALRRLGVPMSGLVRAMWLPMAASVPTWWLAHTVATQIDEPILALALGGALGCAAYVAIVYRWARRLLPDRTQHTEKPSGARVDEPRLEGAT